MNFRIRRITQETSSWILNWLMERANVRKPILIPGEDMKNAQLGVYVLGENEQCPFCMQYFELWLECRCDCCDRPGCYFCLVQGPDALSVAKEEEKICPECSEELEREGRV